MSTKTSQATPTPAWKRLTELQKLSLPDLRTEYEKVVGRPTKSRNRKQLFATLAKHVQSASSDSSVLTSTFKRKPTRGMKVSPNDRRSRRAKRPAKRTSRPLGQRDSRLPQVGSLLTKTYKGKKLHVKVTEDGFEFDGKRYRSLSGVARAVTGATWNGFLFFGLTSRPKTEEE